MNTSSFFIKNKALFGSYPTQEEIGELEGMGVRYFVDLTDFNTDISRIIPYKTKYTHISYPIKDHSIPNNLKTFSIFILNIVKIIKNSNEDELIYINCVGGHGRSGIVVACLLCFLFEISANESLQYTSYFHNNRKEMRDKWRKIGSPQTTNQKKFVQNFFKYYNFIYEDSSISFSNFADVKVFVPGLGIFPSAEAAYQVHKNLEDEHYISKQKKSDSPMYSRELGNNIKIRDDWYDVKDEILSYILTLKILQNDDIKYRLFETHLKPINCNNIVFGLILTKIRNKFLEYETDMQ
jgi:predicted NAD-dependent protein-ADP-ribosyltransferase YbiA (DUF1768 family)